MKIDKFIEKALLKMFKAVGAEKEFSLGSPNILGKRIKLKNIKLGF